jgi:hypothetical protein
MPRKMHHQTQMRATRGRNPKTLLKTAITYLLRVRSSAKPSNKAGPKWAMTIEYMRSQDLIPGVASGQSAGAYDAACKVVAVRMKSGLRVTGRYPRVLTDPLFSASSGEATNERMAKAFLGALKRRGEVILVETFGETAAGSQAALAPTLPAKSVQQKPPVEVADELEHLREQHAGQASWDDDEEDAKTPEQTLEQLRAEHVGADSWGGSSYGVDMMSLTRAVRRARRAAAKSAALHPSGVERTMGPGENGLPFLPPDWAQGKTPQEQAEIDKLRWEMWAEDSSEDESGFELAQDWGVSEKKKTQ